MMNYSRNCLAAIVIACLSQLALTTYPIRIICKDAVYSPCRCTNHQVWASDIETFTCDGIARNRILEVLKRVKSETGQRLYVTIVDKELTTLPKKFLEDTPVAGLTLEAPKLKSLDVDSFLGQENSIESLTFTGCSLSSIPVKSISKLNNLKYFSLVGNKHKFRHLTKDTFAELTNAANILQLNLNDNGISSVAKDALSSFTSIVYLRMNNNELSELKSNSLPAQKLDLIELDGNKFSQIPENLFGKISRGGTMYFRSNNIARISSRIIAESIKTGILYVNVYSNNVTCDCAFKQLAEYFITHPYDIKIYGQCKNFGGKEIYVLQVSDFSNC